MSEVSLSTIRKRQFLPRPRRQQTDESGNVTGTLAYLSAAPIDIQLDSSLTLRIINEDGIYVNVASFCDRATLLRLCTLSKADTEHRCKLAVVGAMPADTRRTKPINHEGWSNVLRERIALDTRLVFTAVHQTMVARTLSNVEQYPHVLESSRTGQLLSIAGGICIRNQVMREGIHRAIFTCLSSGYFRFGLICPDRVFLRESLAMKVDTYIGETLDFAASHSIEGAVGGIVEAGLEFDVTNGIMTIYRKKSAGDQWTKTGTISLRYRSTKYCWVGVSNPAYDGSFSIRRQSGDADTFPSQLKTPDSQEGENGVVGVNYKSS